MKSQCAIVKILTSDELEWDTVEQNMPIMEISQEFDSFRKSSNYKAHRII
jgi:hypothetical protein